MIEEEFLPLCETAHIKRVFSDIHQKEFIQYSDALHRRGTISLCDICFNDHVDYTCRLRNIQRFKAKPDKTCFKTT